jgi:transcriptional regulator with XRE-family HTH domain
MAGGGARKEPNQVLRRIREQERRETREQFAAAMMRVAGKLGEDVYPDDKYVANLETGRISYPGPAYRRILEEVCGRSFSELGFNPLPGLSLPDLPDGGDSGNTSAKRPNRMLRDAIMESGQDLSKIARKVEVDPKTVQRWMTRGTIPHPQHRWKMCKILGRDEAELWPNVVPAQEIAETGNFHETEIISEEEVNITLRRDFVALGGGLAIARQLFGNLENELDQIHMTLDRGTTSEERTSYLEGMSDDLGIQVVKVAPLAVLQPALKSLQSIRRLLDERQPTRHQVRLVKASSKLCTVVGEIMFNIGQFQKAREWYVTAEHAAYDIGDRYLADIALAGQAYLPTYSEDPNGVLTLLGPRLESNPSPSPAVAWLWGFTARAHATLNNPKGFKFAIERAQNSLEHSSPALIAPGIFSFLPEKLAFYEATGAVRLNDTDRALSAANRALAMYDLSETTEPALAKLERASALARGGEVPEACRVATAALLDRKTYHGVTVRTYARKFDDLVHDIDLPETREWREVRAEVHGQRTAIASADEHGF